MMRPLFYHLIRDNEWGEAWCGTMVGRPLDHDQTAFLDQVDCTACLAAIARAGEEAAERLARKCPSQEPYR